MAPEVGNEGGTRAPGAVDGRRLTGALTLP